MKIAVLSDIHGNCYALEPVLKAIRAQGIDQLFILGDFVGYYYHPNQVLEMVDSFNLFMIKGNHELMLNAAAQDSAKAIEIKKKYGSGIEVALEVLSREQFALLTELPEQRSVNLGGINFQLCHGSPWDINAYIYPDSNLESFHTHEFNNRADFILLGHAHYPYISTQPGVTIINPGSIGQARDHGGMACWAVINTTNRTTVFNRTPYDTRPLVHEIALRDPDIPFLRDVLFR